MSTAVYLEAIERNTEGLERLAVGATPICPDCGECEGGAGFSWTPCDSCGATLGGDRYPAHAWRRGDDPTADNLIHLEICTDCVAYIANGELPEGWGL